MISELRYGVKNCYDNKRATLKHIVLSYTVTVKFMSSAICLSTKLEKNTILCWLCRRERLFLRDINRPLLARQMTTRAIQLMALRTGVSLDRVLRARSNRLFPLVTRASWLLHKLYLTQLRFLFSRDDNIGDKKTIKLGNL